MRSHVSRRALPALAVAVCLLAASCIGSGSSDDDGAGTEPTSTGQPTGPTETDATASADPTETTASAVADLTDVAWVVNDLDGLVDDRGRVIAPPPTGGPGDRRPSVLRAADGSIYYVLGRRLWRREVDEAAPEQIETEADEVLGVADDGDGNIIVNPYDDPEVVAEGASRTRSQAGIGDDDNLIVASNGVTVRVLPPDADTDDRGYVTEFRSPARLEVERDGEVEWTIDAGGVAAPWLSVVDFDGRFVMMVRHPTEPADPAMQYIVHDLDCPTGGTAGAGCTRTFWTRWGTASLVGPDRSPGDDELNTVLLDICPTQGIEIAPPAEMTDPDPFDDDFTPEDLAAFREAALQLTTCDPSALGDPEQPGLVYVPGSDDPGEDGWMWTAFADVLRGPFTRETDNTFTWSVHEDGPTGVLDRSFSPPRFHLQPGRRFADHLAVTMTPDSILLTGRTDPDTAEAVVAAAQTVVDERGVGLGNAVDTTGAAHPDRLVDEFTSSIESDLGAGVIGEIQLTDDDVVRNLRDAAEPTADERALGFLMADFASGGEGVYAELPLADDVVMALGSEAVARRQVTELFRPSAWVVNSTDFGGRAGPFNLLDLVPSPLEVVVGPHGRCAGPDALPSPPELVSYTRIGILPLEGSIDSCLEWSAVDLFVDDRGIIQGISLDLSEP